MFYILVLQFVLEDVLELMVEDVSRMLKIGLISCVVTFRGELLKLFEKWNWLYSVQMEMYLKSNPGFHNLDICF